MAGRCDVMQEGPRWVGGGLEAGPQPAVQRVWELTLLVCQLGGGTQRLAKLPSLGEELGELSVASVPSGSTPSISNSNSSRGNAVSSCCAGQFGLKLITFLNSKYLDSSWF